MATPNVFTERRVVLLLDAIKNGQTVRGACARAGISHVTLYDHINKDPTLADRINLARGEAEAKLIDAITKSAHTGETVTTPGGKVTVRPGDWRAAAWLLEHHPETRQKFAAIQKTQVSGDPDNPTPVLEVSVQANADLAQIVQVLHDAGALPELPKQLTDGEEK